ncbi:MAG TPA: M17 family peptidase N-terminal domain-containing protein, partial [Acidimicrobiia bacterium]|nr:M17 family peptidase N-terminal domain-containing protein [Acidimicrobiia bacterium]
MVEIRTTSAEVELTDATLIVGVLVGPIPTPGGEEALAAVDPALVEVAKFEGKTGQVLAVPHPAAQSLILVGLGDEASFETVRAAIG